MAEWLADGLDRGWLTAIEVGAVRSPRSYRPGGLWFLPAWRPDQAEHDVGPFPRRAAAIAAEERMAADHPDHVQ